MTEETGLTDEQKATFMKNIVWKVREYFYEPQSRSDIRLDIDKELKRAGEHEVKES